MKDETRIRDLLDAILESQRTPEEVCAGDPELLARVQGRLRRLRGVEAELDLLFPSTQPVDEGWAQAGTGLPAIPGYAVEALIGRGGMGVVYRARHLRLNRPVALKMMLSGTYASSHERARFAREAESVAGLRHEHIVQIYDVGDLEERPYFTMELVDGGNLAQQLGGTPQPVRQAAALVATLARAVHVAHRGGIVHRDLKPSNVLLTADGTPKISDFGLARRIDEGPTITQSGARIGTPSYMAPEQASGGAITPAVDVYALGALLYEMLTGRPPFRAATSAETERQVIHAEPVAPSRLNPSIARDVETICLACLHKDPQRRYPSAAELADDLERCLRDEPVRARPIGAFERAVKWARRHPARALSLAIATAALGLAAGTAVWIGARRAATAQAVADDLREVAERQGAADWAGARAALERAKARLDAGGPADLRTRVTRADGEIELVKRLADVRLDRSALRQNLAIDPARGDRDYPAVFAGFASVGEDAGVVAARITSSGIPKALVAAFDDWAVCAVDDARRNWLLDVARRADPDPVWRDRARAPELWADVDALAEFVRTVPVDNDYTSLLVALAERIASSNRDAADFVRRIQRAHPDDFWANFHLAKSLLDRKDAECIDFFRAALALRPDTVAVWISLSQALAEQQRPAEAIEYLQLLLARHPESAIAHGDLGILLRNQGDIEGATEHLREALRIAPDYPVPHCTLGLIAMTAGDLERALEETRRCLELAPPGSGIHTGAAAQLQGMQKLVDAARLLPGLLDGSDTQAAPDEIMRCAWLCNTSGRHADAARLYALALERAPELGDRSLGLRHHAALSALRAAEATTGELDTAESARLRAQALAWLQSELDAWSGLLAGGDPGVPAALRTALEVWRSEPGLACVREGGELDRLAEAERTRWLALWDDVAALIERSRTQ